MELGDAEVTYRKQLESKIKDMRGLNDKLSYFDVLQNLGGADPREVFQIWKELNPHPTSIRRPFEDVITPSILGGTFPAPDSSLGQWWFTQRTINWLTFYIDQIFKDSGANMKCSNAPSKNINATNEHLDVLIIGVPTITMAVSSLGYKIGLLDADIHVIEEAKRITRGQNFEGHDVTNFSPELYKNSTKAEKAKLIHGGLKAEKYDVAAPLPEQYKNSAKIVLFDPPWYQPTMDMFIRRSLEAICPPAHILFTLPSRFTRPYVEEEKRNLLKRLSSAGLQVKQYQQEQINYIVPRFEICAFRDIDGFLPIPWRRADLLHLFVDTDNVLENLEIHDPPPPVQISSYARDRRVFRVFVDTSASPREQLENIQTKNPIFTPAKIFQKNISRRKTQGENINVWTSERRGGSTTDFIALKCVLKVWERNLHGVNNRESAIIELIKRGVSKASAESFVESIDRELELWRRFHYPCIRRHDREIERVKFQTLSALATKETGERRHQSPSDTFRSEIQRDRDRIIWAKSLRRLTNKTQLFPVEHSDQLRQRLTHSLEVMQLATTIGDAFGLNRDLIEVGALAHDIGHTPFGHAGEHALDKLLQSINSDIGGFNHYEHGVDVVRYLEDAYLEPDGRGHLGLDLTPSVCECILKHTFCHVNEKWHPERKTVWEASKHKNFINEGNCHLEGQAIRIADKVSYLISDLEDGILLGAIKRSNLLQTRLFHVVPIELTIGDYDSFHSDFISQRKNILKVLMEDIILASEARISRLGSPSGARSLGMFTIDHSEEIKIAINEIWYKLQQECLHTDARVLMANMRAARIIKELTVLFALFPNLIDHQFVSSYDYIRKSEYMKFYTNRAGAKNLIPSKMADFLPIELLIGTKKPREFYTELLIQSKDYVASLTDAEAKYLHHKFISSYSDKT